MLIITVVILLLLEGLLRVIFPEKLISPPPPPPIVYQFDSLYLYDLKPNLEESFIRSASNGGDTINWKTDANGWRGGVEKDTSGICMMVCGDSNIHSKFSTLENSFARQLEKQLQTQIDTPVISINAGVTAFGPDQSFLKLKRQFPVYEPDLVVLTLFADNDFGDLVKNRLMEVEEDGMVRWTNIQRSPSSVFYLPQDRDRQPPIFEKSLLLRSTQKIHRILYPLPVESTAEGYLKYYFEQSALFYQSWEEEELRAAAQFDDFYDVDLAVYPTKPAAQLKRRLMKSLLKEYRQWSIQQDVPFLVVILPSVIDLTENYVVSYKDLSQYAAYRPQNLSDEFVEICQSLGLDFVNLFPVFESYGAESLYFLEDDNHWNDQGQQIAAEVVANYVSQHFTPVLTSK